MSRALFLSVLALAVGLLCLSGSRVNAQDCERIIPGNAQSPCKPLDYLDGIQPPTFLVEQFTDNRGEYACQGFLEFRSSTPLTGHSAMRIMGSDRRLAAEDYSGIRYSVSLAGGFMMAGDEGVRIKVGPAVYLTSSVEQSPRNSGYAYLAIVALFGKSVSVGSYPYSVVSDIFQRPEEVADYQFLMNQCLAGITRQLEHEAALEDARKQAEEDRIRAETAAKEAKNKAELAAIELASAEAALQAAEELNAAKLKETILSIKREDAIRAAWQQVILVRMAGLEERTRIWSDAVARWTEEDLQFSTAMEARI